nr:methyltransferase [Kibdelosporangium sp. MJ126-NF4]
MADLATPMSVRVAATLSLAERAGSAGATAQQLASETGTSALALQRMLDHLVTVGVFDLDQETGRYRPTELGAQMSEDAPGGVKPLLDINCAGGRAELAFVDLLDTITTGAPSYPIRYGRDFWSDIDADPKLRSSFDAQMNWRFREQAAQIAERFDWSRYLKILDLGGGDGGLLAAILKTHPTVHGQVLDLAPSAAAAAARFANTEFADRAGAIPGSFFNPLPQGADAYLLSDILHDWDDESSGKILARCREAAAPNATVVVIEPLRGGAGTAIDLFMLMCFGGSERTVGELTELAAENGLTLENSSQVSDGRTAMEFKVTAQAS